MDKYYVPTIEEFYVGFEYLLRQQKEIFDYYDLGIIDDEIREGLIKVKYLDKEDMESLGFKLEVVDCGQDTDENELGIRKVNDYAYIGTFFLDRFIHNSNIELYNSFYNIKNRSELKVIMKQLGII